MLSRLPVRVNARARALNDLRGESEPAICLDREHGNTSAGAIADQGKMNIQVGRAEDAFQHASKGGFPRRGVHSINADPFALTCLRLGVGSNK